MITGPKLQFAGPGRGDQLGYTGYKSSSFVDVCSDGTGGSGGTEGVDGAGESEGVDDAGESEGVDDAGESEGVDGPGESEGSEAGDPAALSLVFLRRPRLGLEPSAASGRRCAILHDCQLYVWRRGSPLT